MRVRKRDLVAVVADRIAAPATAADGAGQWLAAIMLWRNIVLLLSCPSQGVVVRKLADDVLMHATLRLALPLKHD